MSLLFESAIQEFEFERSSMCSATEDELGNEGGGVEIDLSVVGRFAEKHSKLDHPERGPWTVVPLHKHDRAELTGEYVAYRDDEVYPDTYVYEDSEGNKKSMESDEFGNKPLSKRLRFWHSDNLPEEYPEYYDSPIDQKEDPKNPMNPEKLVEGMGEHVKSEREATLEENLEKAEDAEPREVFDEGGGAVPELRCLGKGGEGGGYKFKVFPEEEDTEEGEIDGSRDYGWYVPNTYDVHQDSRVLVHPPDENSSPDEFPVPATVRKIRALDMEIDIDWDEIENRLEIERYLDKERHGFGLISVLNEVPFERELNAVSRVKRDEDLKEVLSGGRSLTFEDPLAAQTGQQDEDLNQEQKLAVDHALLADDFFCLHGPPGTGKTRTLVEIVRRAAKSGRDVLVCADSNQAIDNILVGSSTEGEVDDGSLHKYSQHGAEEFTVERRNTGRSSNRFVRKMYADSDVNRGDVVVSTNNSAADIHRQFDLAVIDEATQATCTSCLIPISKSDKFVLAGDHKQLPPYSAEEGPAQSEFGKSMFEHMYASGGVYESVGIQLKTQYRMHEEIVRFPNHGFYDGSLRNGRKVEEPEEMDRPAVAYNLGGETEKIGTSYRNTTEAKMVERVVLRVIEEEGINSKNVGVITPYSAQVKEITRRLEGSGGEAATVDTIDSFQGSEREAVVISFVRSNPDGDIGFLGREEDGPRRLNVAMTRAKRFLGLVGDFHTLRYSQKGKCDEVYESLYRHLRDRSMKDIPKDFLS